MISCLSKCEKRKGINLCHYLRARHDHARTFMHWLHITHQNPWRTMENNFMWSWQISVEYSKAFMPLDMVTQVFCKRYLLSPLRFFVDRFVLRTCSLIKKTPALCSQVSGLFYGCTLWNYLSLSFTLLVLCLHNGGKKEKEKSMCYYPVNLPLEEFFEHQCLSRKNVCISITKHTNFFCFNIKYKLDARTDLL